MAAPGKRAATLLNRYRSLSEVKKTALWFTICNYLQRGTAVITVPIFTRLLTTQQYGLFNTYLAWFEVLGLLTSLKLPHDGLNNGLIRYETDKDGFASAMVGLTVILNLVWALIYLVFHKTLDSVIGMTPFLMLFLFIQMLFNPPLYIWINRERFDFRYRTPVLVTMLITVLSPVISVLAVLFTPYKAEARIIALSCMQGLFGLILLFVLLRKGKRFFHREYWRFALRFSLPLLFHYLSMVVLTETDRIQISRICGDGATAVYSVAYSAAMLVNLVVQAVSGTFSAWMYRKLKNKAYDDITSVVGKLYLLIGGACAMIAALAPDLVRLMATEEYMEAVRIIPPVSCSVFFIFVYTMFANVSMYYDETKLLSLAAIVCSAANIILNDIFIRRYGYVAAGWTTLFSYALLTVLHALLYRKTRLRHGLPIGMLCEKKLPLLSAVMVLGCGGMLISYSLGWLRYLFLAILALSTYAVYRKLRGRNGKSQDDL